MLRLLAVVLLGAVLAGCSTSVVTKQEMPSEIRADVKVAELKVEVPDHVAGPADLGARFEDAVRKAIAERKREGASEVRLELTVTRFEVVGQGMRFFIGAFAGANKMASMVSVVDLKTESTVGKFIVEREANPGGYGVFYDQAQATIEATADGVADGLFGTKPE